MTMLYDKTLRKKATNVSINSELLEKAKQNKINLSSTLEKSLEQILLAKEKENWEANNKVALEEYNQKVIDSGVFSDSVRSF
jgi:antitoxin CcdA